MRSAFYLCCCEDMKFDANYVYCRKYFVVAVERLNLGEIVSEDEFIMF